MKQMAFLPHEYEQLPPITLRPRQVDAVEAISAAFRAGHKAPLVVIAGGGGKTVIMGGVCQRTIPRGRVCILVNRDRLAKQARKRITQVSGILPGLEQGQIRASAYDRIVVASVQTMAQPGRRIAGEPFMLVCVDEAHHCVDDSDYKAALDNIGAKFTAGFTGSKKRHDGRSLFEVFDHLAYELTFPDLVKIGYQTNFTDDGLCDVVVETVPIEIDVSKVGLNSKGEFDENQMSNALKSMLGRYADFVAEKYADARMISFLPLRRNSLAWTEQLRERGLAAFHAEGTKKKERWLRPYKDVDALLEGFNNGDYNFLSNSMLISEGADFPIADTLMMFRLVISRVLYEQMVWRIVRLHPASGKRVGRVLDPMFVCERHQVMTVARMLSEDEEQAERVAKRIKLGEAISQALKSDRDALFVQRVEEARFRSPYVRELGQLELDLGVDITGWTPEKPSQAEPVTVGQRRYLSDLGINPDMIETKGQASLVIGASRASHFQGKPSHAQLKQARELGLANPEQFSRDGLARWLSDRTPDTNGWRESA